MATVREIEVELADLEDRILNDLGYREYTVEVNSTIITPQPKVVHKSISNFKQEKIDTFVRALGSGRNPSSYFVLEISRSVSEDLVRHKGYWTLTRGSLVSTCAMVDYTQTDSRHKVTLGVIKIEAST